MKTGDKTVFTQTAGAGGGGGVEEADGLWKL